MSIRFDTQMLLSFRLAALRRCAPKEGVMKDRFGLRGQTVVSPAGKMQIKEHTPKEQPEIGVYRAS